MPFSRILTPIFGGGDEVYALNSHWNNHTLAWIVAVVIVLALAVPPVIKVWNIIENRKKIWWLIGLIFVPFLATGIVVFGILQSLLLENGVMNEYWILGSPMLVTVWLMFCIVVCTIFGHSLTALLQPIEAKEK
jgi:Na+-transporting NADH:ubiquinone oxidoreductase subunit NqrE